MDTLSAFGLFAVIAMVVCYSLESRARGYILAFAFACVLGSAYGFLQGAWPFGAVEIVWAGIAGARWWKKGKELRAISAAEGHRRTTDVRITVRTAVRLGNSPRAESRKSFIKALQKAGSDIPPKAP